MEAGEGGRGSSSSASLGCSRGFRLLVPLLPQVMFLQRKGQVIMTIELLDTEEAQTEDPVEVQVRTTAPVPCTHPRGWGQHCEAPTKEAHAHAGLAQAARCP